MVRVIFTKGNFKELWGNHKQCTQHVSLMEHCQSVDTQDSSSVGFFRLITTHLCTDYFTYPYHLIACQNTIVHNNIITVCNFNQRYIIYALTENFVQSPIKDPFCSVFKQQKWWSKFLDASLISCDYSVYGMWPPQYVPTTVLSFYYTAPLFLGTK